MSRHGHLLFVASAVLALAPACADSLEVKPQPPPFVRVVGHLDAAHAGPFGTNHILFLNDASFRYGWAAFCQARADTNGDRWIASGDHFVPYLATGAGTGTPIDAYLGRDPSGRYAAVARAHRLLLFDAATRRLLDIGPAPSTRVELAFDHNRRLAYVRDTGYQRDVILLDLTTLVARSLRGTRALVRSLAFSGQEGGLYIDENLAFEEVVEDTNGNGRLEAYLDARGSPCQFPEQPRCRFGDPRPDDGRRVSLHLGAPTHPDREEAVDLAYWRLPDPYDDCLRSTPTLATSSAGASLVALGGYLDGKEQLLAFGPVEWRSPIPPPLACKPQRVSPAPLPGPRSSDQRVQGRARDQP